MLKKDKRGTKVKGTLVPHWKKEELDIWLNNIEPKTLIGVVSFGSNWISWLFS